MRDDARSFLELTDWRRRVAAMWEQWRAVAAAPGGEATAGAVGAADAAHATAAAQARDATAAFRESKDRLFREHPQSPLPAGSRAGFAGLRYWPYDPSFRMTVSLLPARAGPASRPDRAPHIADLAATAAPEPRGIALPSSGSESMAFRLIGRVDLLGPLAGHSLSVFWIDAYGGGIFLPFRDATSGAETYGAGRYLLDTIKSADHGGDAASGTLVLDLNMAFHPSCAYDPRWSCPLAPPENRLPVPVRAGERLGP